MTLTAQGRTVFPTSFGSQPSANELTIFDNLGATTDPTTSNDSTQGYNVGSIWYNITSGRSWECSSNAAGAATWYFTGNIPGTGTTPPSSLSQMGSGTGSMPSGGFLNRQINATPVNPVGTGGDNVLAVYSLPASSFDIAGRGIQVTAAGYFGATSNNKTVKLWYNPTGATVGLSVTGGVTMASTGVTAASSSGFVLVASVFKYGAAASNTQLYFASQVQAGITFPAMAAPSTTSTTESTAILIAVTGNAASATTDINLSFFSVQGFD